MEEEKETEMKWNKNEGNVGKIEEEVEREGKQMKYNKMEEERVKMEEDGMRDEEEKEKDVRK
jgi:hypothetical protein